jgi:hypothetical protein
LSLKITVRVSWVALKTMIYGFFRFDLKIDGFGFPDLGLEILLDFNRKICFAACVCYLFFSRLIWWCEVCFCCSSLTSFDFPLRAQVLPLAYLTKKRFPFRFCSSFRSPVPPAICFPHLRFHRQPFFRLNFIFASRSDSFLLRQILQPSLALASLGGWSVSCWISLRARPILS